MRVEERCSDPARIHHHETAFRLAVLIRVSGRILSRPRDGPAVVGHGVIDNTVAGHGYRGGYDALGHVDQTQDGAIAAAGEIQGKSGRAVLKHRIAHGVRRTNAQVAVVSDSYLGPADARVANGGAGIHVVNPDRLSGFVLRRVAIAIELVLYSLDFFTKKVVVAR